MSRAPLSGRGLDLDGLGLEGLVLVVEAGLGVVFAVLDDRVDGSVDVEDDAPLVGVVRGFGFEVLNKGLGSGTGMPPV